MQVVLVEARGDLLPRDAVHPLGPVARPVQLQLTILAVAAQALDPQQPEPALLLRRPADRCARITLVEDIVERPAKRHFAAAPGTVVVGFDLLGHDGTELLEGNGARAIVLGLRERAVPRV